MSMVYVCPSCGTRWKIIESTDHGEASVLCPNCAPKVIDLAEARRRREQPAAAEVSGPQCGTTNPVTSTFTITHSSPPGAWTWPPHAG